MKNNHQESNAAKHANRFAREYVYDAVRRFFKEKGYREVETPLFTLTPDPEPTIHPFWAMQRYANGRMKDGYLITSPEFYMKRVLAEDSGPIFQITKAFRNNELPGSRHNPEFTILEWYKPNADYQDLMVESAELVRFVISFVHASLFENRSIWHNSQIALLDSFEYVNRTIQLTKPQQITYVQAYKKYAGISELAIYDKDTLVKEITKKEWNYNLELSLLDLLSLLYVDHIEPNLGKDAITSIYDFPAEQAALARKKKQDPRYAERFELYVAGMELENAFSELLDPKEQKERFEQQLADREKAGEQTWPLDKMLLEAIAKIDQPVAGAALGLDRLLMLATNQSEISSVLWFPESAEN